MNRQKQQQNLSKSRDGGYTIIESLVAMIVVSVLMIAIAPVMAFSVATRVQARRTELATQAARAYIDALRTGALRPPGSTPASPPGFPTIRVPAEQPVATAAVPSGTADLYCVNLDDQPGCQTDSSKDFYVQGAWQSRLDPPAPNTNDPTTIGYELMVRVYRADSFASGVSLNQNPSQAKKQSVVGSGLGDRTMPVVEMTTQIPPTANGSSSAYRSLCSRLAGTNSCQ
ncbi:MAG: hormogonium polysaccharide secretion pseudopilin HpsB [Oscillatoriaceae cyanobacterium Prado104]|jgi:prepilin-type N-terminal cleavage/methylation domain-containing protein|nr:hormogonium polysaccharide secretion pseudopilin HpsB [Oscillatoriaceae cyanobacterium Prado104]